MTIIKADHGFELLEGSRHDGEFKIERSPIVAWRIEADFAEPIALNPLFDDAFLTAVKCLAVRSSHAATHCAGTTSKPSSTSCLRRSGVLGATVPSAQTAQLLELVERSPSGRSQCTK
jgi:hypothetical protein